MHNKKIIAKGLVFGIVLSNAPVNSMADVVEEYEINSQGDKEGHGLREDKNLKVYKLEKAIKDVFGKLVEPREEKEIIKVNRNIVEGSLLEISLTDGEFVPDLTGNPGRYETIRVATTGNKKLDIVDFQRLNESSIPNIDLSKSSADSIPDNAFKDSTSLQTFKYPKGVSIIGEMSFMNCRGMTGSLIIPDSVITIGMASFYGCSGFDGELKLSNSLDVIGTNAFMYCSGFTGKLTIPESVTAIMVGAFMHCTGFTGDLVIPNSIKLIPNNVFMGCTGLSGDLIIGDSVTEIRNDAFKDCSGFKGSLVIGNSLEKLHPEVFRGCNGFTGDLIIPNSLTLVAPAPFNGLNNLDNIIIKIDNLCPHTRDLSRG